MKPGELFHKFQVYCKADYWDADRTSLFAPRRDKCGKEIHWANHGDRQSPFGWEIDHIVADSREGSILSTIFNHLIVMII